jgi:apolipoprotein N-acyltransferase
LTRHALTRAGLALAGVAASALLLAAYARGHWWLGFILLVPWLLALDRARSLTASFALGLAMAVGYVAAALGWFAPAIAAYTGWPLIAANALLLAGSPLLVPEILAFAVTRRLARGRFGPVITAMVGAAAWVGVERLSPTLFGDTLGHGLAPATTLRQAADLGGAALLTVGLLLVNESIAGAIGAVARRAAREALGALALAAALVGALWGYGHLRLADLARAWAEPAPSLRVAMVQTALVDYEARRREVGAYAVVREVLDVHLALSREAIDRHGAEALLWSETVYPTTFGQPRSADGAALDQEILDFVAASGVPLVFGTYERDGEREWNVAAFVEPNGVLGRYRKTHAFPLTEHVPAWLDGPRFRRALPWAGSWQRGDGARVLPLRVADGRTLEVVPLICLDDVDPRLAIDGRRLGAQAIVGLSNDAWFSQDPRGAELHLKVAAFRSIETRMPQLRVTTNGLSAFIDPSGEVLARTGMGDRAVLAGAVPIVDPPPTLMVRLGDWVGGAALGVLALVALAATVRPRARALAGTATPARALFDGRIVALTPPARLVLALLRLLAALGLAWLAVRMAMVDGFAVNSLDQLRIFGGAVVAPLVAGSLLRRWFAGRASVGADALVLDVRRARIEIPIGSIAQVRVWRVPLPAAGVDLRLASGRRFELGLGLADPRAFVERLRAAGSEATFASPGDAARARWAAIRATTPQRWFDHAAFRYLAFPLLPALVAFRLHQVIAFGGPFGEWLTHGAGAWFAAMAIWWAAWALGLMLFAAALRIGIEVATGAALAGGEGVAVAVRRLATRLARVAYFAGVPLLLVMRLL